MLPFLTLPPRVKQKQSLIDIEVRFMLVFTNGTQMGRWYCFYCLVTDVWWYYLNSNVYFLFKRSELDFHLYITFEISLNTLSNPNILGVLDFSLLPFYLFIFTVEKLMPNFVKHVLFHAEILYANNLPGACAFVISPENGNW